MKIVTLALAALTAGMIALPAQASAAGPRPVTDCPLRDAPFSAESPLVDILLSDAARGVLNQHTGGKFANVPQSFLGTTPPTFAAILTVRTAARFTGMKDDAIAAADRDLRALPVTEADKLARCARYDNEVPTFDLPKGKPRILLFEKINGFKDTPSVNAARAALTEMARRKGWALAITDKGGAFNPQTLRKFDAVIWNNISGDVLTLSQRSAFQRYMQRGGGFIAIHGSAGDPAYFWDWYADTLIGARFNAHPMAPQFQDARIAVNTVHPLASGLPGEWTMNDEWYSFRTNPRSVGAQVVLTLDESTYSPVGPMGADLRMGDHPLAWTNCIGKGRMFYSAIGHRPETYVQPQHVALLENAITWVATSRKACPAKAAR
jgi:type 1 glutamine amidotransferase